MAWVRCCGGGTKLPQTLSIVLDGQLQSGFALNGAGMSQLSNYVKANRASGQNGGSITLTTPVIGYSTLVVVFSNSSTHCSLRTTVNGNAVVGDYTGGQQTKQIALNPNTDLVSAIYFDIANNDGYGAIYQLYLVA